VPDVMAVIRVREYDDLANLVTEQISKIPGMTRTITQMAFRCYSKHDMERIWGEMMGK
jgi:DNA-binding Lrp family transcriptional regulator